MAWLLLIVAGIFEIIFVILMKLSKGFTRGKFTALAAVAGFTSFYLLSRALIDIPVGTGYGVWTGIGAAGSVVAGMLFFKESKDRRKLLFLAMIISGVVGLKLVAG
ncbi:DMT family transporter [Jeotgalibacillus soli]|uniref:Multidrug transporter n=1 Tax=Jeotgalibacillus soli TaxID=889306 RepID=A0A0C2VTD2_9BACL|nr:multidrug efflux SMR transporter [Jeotgalibacillus soli]KIL52187.1 multidrug transporter [Jeotgalibacillus soli]